MVWKLDKAKPICPQIYENICVEIAKGSIKPNDRLASVREIAIEAGVNPNTVQKAFEMLESSALVYSVRGSGWFAADNKDEALKILNEHIREKTEAYFSDMQAFGLDDKQIKKYVEEWEK